MSNWWKAVSIWSMLGPPSLFKQRRGKAPERNAALEVCVRWRFGRWKLKSCLNSARCSELSARREKKTLSALKYRERHGARGARSPAGRWGRPHSALPGSPGRRGGARQGPAWSRRAGRDEPEAALRRERPRALRRCAEAAAARSKESQFGVLKKHPNPFVEVRCLRARFVCLQRGKDRAALCPYLKMELLSKTKGSVLPPHEEINLWNSAKLRGQLIFHSAVMRFRRFGSKNNPFHKARLCCPNRGVRKASSQTPTAR